MNNLEEQIQFEKQRDILVKDIDSKDNFDQSEYELNDEEAITSKRSTNYDDRKSTFNDEFSDNPQFQQFQSVNKNNVISFEKEDNWQILLIGKINTDEIFPVFSKVIKSFAEKKCTFYVEDHSEQKYKDQLIADKQEDIIDSLVLFNGKDHENIIDLVITVGGDGTILYAMSHFQNRNSPPVIAIEKGTLGFMCMYNVENIEEDIQKIIQNIKINKNLTIERKMRIRAVIRDKDGNISTQNGVKKEFHALNEIVIDRGLNASCLKMEILLNNEPLTKTVGDGLIFSTPTGSTAYSLSAGGPIIQNDVRGISLVPICAFSLSFRSIVLPQCSDIRVRLTPDNRGQGKITGDGQKTFELLPNEEVYIESSENEVNIVRQACQSDNVHEWMFKLKKMLNWNSNFSK